MKKKNLLVIAPHPDDEILGAGGTMMKYVKNGFGVTVLIVAGHRPPLYPESVYQQTIREAKAAHQVIGVDKTVFLDIPATMVGALKTHELNGMIATVVEEVKPVVVLVPYPDRHVDHRLVFDSAMVATRPINGGVAIELIAAYETLSETHWNAPHIEPNFVPNWVCNITVQFDHKLRALRCYKSQIPGFPGARSLEAVKALAMFRGTQAGFAFGEAFHIIRMCT
jgi:N-acetylglucosamine malate deacetylase 1